MAAGVIVSLIDCRVALLLAMTGETSEIYSPSFRGDAKH
jgi:hypothetical protein